MRIGVQLHLDANMPIIKERLAKLHPQPLRDIPIQKVDVADKLIQSGALQVALGFNGPDYDLGVVREWLSRRDGLNAS